MQVKVGVLRSGREVAIESGETSEQVEQAVAQALSSGGVLRLMDRDGTTTLVPAANSGYVEIGASRKGGVGFGAL